MNRRSSFALLKIALVASVASASPLAPAWGDDPDETKRSEPGKEEKKEPKPGELDDAPRVEDLVPFDKLDEELAKELRKVTENASVRHHVEKSTIRCTADTYAWLLRKLPLASVAARELDVGKYAIEDKGGSRFSIDDTEGARADCERVFEDEGRVVIVARGSVEALLLPKTKGTGVIVTRWRQDKQDRKRVATDCFVFFRVTNEALHALSAPFRDSLGKILGGKLDGLVGSASKVACEVDKDPDKVLQALSRSKKLKDEELEEFRRKFLLN